MGKYSKPKYPSFSGGVVSINGQKKAVTSKKGNNVVSNYKMSNAEKQAYDFAQNSLVSNLPNINVFDTNTQQGLQSQLDAYTQKGQKMINNLYSPMLNSLKNDIASRFGNLDNSVFLNNLNAIEANRAESVNSLAQDVLNRQDELINNELTRRYNYLNFLQNLQNQANSTMLNYINSSQNNSSSGNSYNQQAYNANLQNSGSSFGNLFANLGTNLGMSLLQSANPGSAAASAIMGIVGRYV